MIRTLFVFVALFEAAVILLAPAAIRADAPETKQGQGDQAPAKKTPAEATEDDEAGEETKEQGEEGDDEAKPAPAVIVQLQPTSARNADSLRFRVSARARQGKLFIYPRIDLWRFQVEGPTGTTDCAPARKDVRPIADFYRSITASRPWRVTLVAEHYCPGAFDEAGEYQVRPIVDLVYGGSVQGTKATTGTFEGSPVRVVIKTSKTPNEDESPAKR